MGAQLEKATPPTPPDVVHTYTMEQIRDRCVHDLVLANGVCVGCSRQVGDL
jgi:hypothetical protein